MPVLRMEIEKTGALSFLSHLDYVEALQRALRRSGLPVTYSQGFNPHMKVAFGAALAVGVSSSGEWVDVEVDEMIELQEIRERLIPNLPAGMGMKRFSLYEAKPESLSQWIEAATYEAEFELKENEFQRIREALQRSLQVPEILWEIISPKRRKTMDIRKELLSFSCEEKEEGHKCLLTFCLRLTPQGSLKPTEFLKYLERQKILSLDEARIIRTGFWRNIDGTWQKL